MKKILTKMQAAVRTGLIHFTLEEVKHLEELSVRSEALLRTCQAQVGMVTGQEIGEHLAKLNDESFNEKIYNYERLPEGQ